MPPTSRLLQCVSMPAAIGTKSFLLIGVASLLHAKAIGTPLIKVNYGTRFISFNEKLVLRARRRASIQ